MDLAILKLFKSISQFNLVAVTNHAVLCISTSERVLRMLFAVQNQFVDAKTIFYVLFNPF